MGDAREGIANLASRAGSKGSISFRPSRACFVPFLELDDSEGDR